MFPWFWKKDKGAENVVEREVKKKIDKWVIFVRRDAKIDTEKLESVGFLVVMGDSVKELEDYKIIEKVTIITTTYTNEAEEPGDEESKDGE